MAIGQENRAAVDYVAVKERQRLAWETGDYPKPRYRAAGPPKLVIRVLAPVPVLLTIVVLGTGGEMWLWTCPAFVD